MAVNFKKEFGNTRTRKPDLTTLVYGKVPPQAPELEEAVLGAILLEREKQIQVREIITSPDCFYVDANQKIYEAICQMIDRGMQVDLLTVTDELRKMEELEIVGGAYYLTRLTMSVISSAHVESHARLIMEKFIQREIIRICGMAISEAYEDSTDVFDLLDHVSTQFFEISQGQAKKEYVKVDRVAAEVFEGMAEMRELKTEITGVPSMFKDLDRNTLGWQKTDLIIIAARPATGKTAFVLNLALNAANNMNRKYPVGFFSLEMSKNQLVKRMASTISGIEMSKLRLTSRMSQEEFDTTMASQQKFTNLNIFLDDSAAITVREIAAKARRMVEKDEVELLIIDYLGLISGDAKSGNREQEVSKISRDLKKLAKDLEIPIILLSQLNRAVETRKDPTPTLADLRESGAIEQDADIVGFLYKPTLDTLKGIPSLSGLSEEDAVFFHLAKHRNGDTDKFFFEFKKATQLFKEYQFNAFPEPFKPMIPDNPSAGMPGYRHITEPKESYYNPSPENADDLPF